MSDELIHKSDELIRKSEVIKAIKRVLGGYCMGSAVAGAINEIQPVNAVELPCKVGDTVYIVERDENNRAAEATGYIFLSRANESVICTYLIRGLESVDDIIRHHIDKTARDWDTNLSVFPIEDCFCTREEAEKALEDLKNE